MAFSFFSSRWGFLFFFSARRAAAEDAGAVPAGDRRSWRWPLRGRVAWGAAAAALAVCAVTWSYLTGPQVYQTRFGEQRSILLEDGSRITLNTASRIEGMTKGQPHMLFVSETTREWMQEVPDDLELVDEFAIRGREAKMKIYSIPDPPGSPPTKPT